MKRFFPLLAGLTVVLAAGLVQGLWTGRWQESADLKEAADRLERLPNRYGPWEGKKLTLDRDEMRLARAAAWWARTFVNRRSGAEVTVILLAGRPGPMAVHRPEQCYRGAGYEMMGPAGKAAVPSAPGLVPGDFWTADFVKDGEAEPEHLRIYWSWFAGGRWQASDSPRLAFARRPVLYKLYVIRSFDPNPETRDGQEEPCLDLMKHLLPKLGQALTRPGELVSGLTPDPRN